MKQTLIASLGLVLLAALGYFCIYALSLSIQNDIHSRTQAALDEKKFESIKIITSGRDVVLSGEVISEEIKQQALDLAQRVHSVRVVNDQLNIVVQTIDPTQNMESNLSKQGIQAPKLEPLPNDSWSDIEE
jgi:hypothetical protein